MRALPAARIREAGGFDAACLAPEDLLLICDDDWYHAAYAEAGRPTPPKATSTAGN